MNYIQKRCLSLCLSLLILCPLVTAQESENSGYILFKNGKQEAVIFAEEDLLNNPTEILYRTSVEGELLKGSLTDIQEFWIPGSYKYTKKTVDIDRSGDKSSNITATRSPVFNQETLFLQVLIEGENSLYMYREGDLVRFFYSLGGGDINQFVYKVYLAKVSVRGKLEDKPRLNETYKQQVVNELICEDIDVELARDLQYRKNDFMGVFKTYNSCLGLPYVEWKGQKATKYRFGFKFRTALNNIGYGFNGTTNVNLGSRTSLSIGQGLDVERINAVQFGTELEMRVPTKGDGIVSAFVELSFQRHQATVINNFSSNDIDLSFNLFTVGAGLRYYLPVRPNILPFAEIGIGIPSIQNSGSTVRVNGQEGSLGEDTYPPERIIGIGVSISDKLNFSIRHGSNSSLSTSTLEYSYVGFSLSLNVL